MAGMLLITSCTSSKLFIKIPQERAENFTHPSLRKFVTNPENKGASVVVRDPNVTKDGASTSGDTYRLSALIERGLMKKGYITRDRKLFDNAVAKMENNSDYVALREKTGTDLLFEITHFGWDEYVVKEAYKKNEKVPFKSKKENVYIPLVGFSIEIKVILLQDNLIAGTYKYFYTPCSSKDGGCEVVDWTTDKRGSQLVYKYPKSDKEEIINVGQEESSRKISLAEKLDKELSEFISNVVVPSMFKEMGEK
jgi:hypothetical protein